MNVVTDDIKVSMCTHTLNSSNGESQTIAFYYCFTDKPKPPEDLKVSEIFAEHCLLSWSPPSDDGGGEITEYIVERQEEGSGFWEKVPNLGSGTTCQVFIYQLKFAQNCKTLRHIWK